MKHGLNTDEQTDEKMTEKGVQKTGAEAAIFLHAVVPSHPSFCCLLFCSAGGGFVFDDRPRFEDADFGGFGVLLPRDAQVQFAS